MSFGGAIGVRPGSCRDGGTRFPHSRCIGLHAISIVRRSAIAWDDLVVVVVTRRQRCCRKMRDANLRIGHRRDSAGNDNATHSKSGLQLFFISSAHISPGMKRVFVPRSHQSGTRCGPRMARSKKRSVRYATRSGGVGWKGCERARRTFAPQQPERYGKPDVVIGNPDMSLLLYGFCRLRPAVDHSIRANPCHAQTLKFGSAKVRHRRCSRLGYRILLSMDPCVRDAIGPPVRIYGDGCRDAA